MKKMASTIASFVVVATASLTAQSSTPSPLGVWQGTLDGLPSVTLTLANDAGEIGGTVVFNAINGDSHRILFHQAHTLLYPKLEGDTLTFQIKLGGDRPGLARVTIVFHGDKAQLHCPDCGPDSPIAELTRQFN